MCLFKIDNIGLYASFKECNREVISFGNAGFHFNTCHNVKLSRYYKVEVHTEPKNTKLVKVNALLVYISFDDFNPCLVGILHHLGIFFGDVVACIVFFLFALNLFLNVIVEFKKFLQFFSDVLCFFLVGIALTDIVKVEIREETIVFLFFLFLLFTIAGIYFSNSTDAGVSTNIDVRIHFVVHDVGENPSHFPNRSAFYIEGQKNFFLEYRFSRDNDFIFSVLADGKLNLEGKSKFYTNTVGLFKVLQYTLTHLDVGFSLTLCDFIEKSTSLGECRGTHRRCISYRRTIGHRFKSVGRDIQIYKVVSRFLDETAVQSTVINLRLYRL